MTLPLPTVYSRYVRRAYPVCLPTQLTHTLSVQGSESFAGMIYQSYAPTGSSRQLLSFLGASDPDPFTRTRRLMSTQYQRSWFRYSMEQATTNALRFSRDVQNRRSAQSTLLMDVYYQNCRFESNRQGSPNAAGVVLFGVASIVTPFCPTTFVNCTFENNTFNGTDGSVTGYAIYSAGSPLTLENNCFIDNDFIGVGPVQAFASAPVAAVGNYIDGDDDLFCSFVALSDALPPQSASEITCVEADKASCDVS